MSRSETSRRGGAARRADRRARLLRRACEADVRPAGARVRHRGDARVELQDGARRQRARLPGERRHHAVPRAVAPRRQVGDNRGVRQAEPLSRQHRRLFPRETEEHAGRRRQPARSHAGALRQPDGRRQPPFAQATAAVPGRTRQRSAQRQSALQGAAGHADGERALDRLAQARSRRCRSHRRQHRSARDLRRVDAGCRRRRNR